MKPCRREVVLAQWPLHCIMPRPDRLLLPALKVALSGSVKSESAHQGDAGKEDQARRSDLWDVSLVSDFGETAGAGQLLMWNGRHANDLFKN